MSYGANKVFLCFTDFTPNTKEAFYTLLQGFLFSLEGRGYLRYITVEDKMNISNIQVLLS